MSIKDIKCELRQVQGALWVFVLLNVTLLWIVTEYQSAGDANIKRHEELLNKYYTDINNRYEKELLHLEVDQKCGELDKKQRKRYNLNCSSKSF